MLKYKLFWQNRWVYCMNPVNGDLKIGQVVDVKNKELNGNTIHVFHLKDRKGAKTTVDSKNYIIEEAS